MKKPAKVLLPSDVEYAQESFDLLARPSITKVQNAVSSASPSELEALGRARDRLVETNAADLLRLRDFADKLADEGSYGEACMVRAFAEGIHLAVR